MSLYDSLKGYDVVKKLNIFKLKMCLFVFFLAIVSFSVILMPFNVDDNTMIPPWISGALFWFGVIGVFTIVVIINIKRKRNSEFYKNSEKVKQLGLICFFQNRAAIVFDILMFISIIAFIILIVMGSNYYFEFICLSVFIFTFGMHCMI